ncbi:hypothetical protein [Leucobacter sp. W1478]|uniref:hypothetical protein n=1 Tax=Leucobacter sp. W1478 TaxID=3439065 RepID=UPI003F2F0AA6
MKARTPEQGSNAGKPRQFFTVMRAAVAASLVLLVAVTIVLIDQAKPVVHKPQLGDPALVPAYLHPETKGDGGLVGASFIGEHEGIEYWEGVDADNGRCLLYGDPIARYGGSSCTTDIRFEQNGLPAAYFFPNLSAEVHLLPDDVDPSPLQARGYVLLDGRVAISERVGLFAGERIPLDRASEDAADFVWIGPAGTQASVYRN